VNLLATVTLIALFSSPPWARALSCGFGDWKAHVAESKYAFIAKAEHVSKSVAKFRVIKNYKARLNDVVEVTFQDIRVLGAEFTPKAKTA